jgi:hypothetical protein
LPIFLGGIIMKKAIIVSLVVIMLFSIFMTGCSNPEDGKVTSDNNQSSTSSTTNKSDTSSTIKNESTTGNAVTDVGEGASNMAGNIGDAASNVADGVGEAASDVARGIGNGFRNMTN